MVTVTRRCEILYIHTHNKEDNTVGIFRIIFLSLVNGVSLRASEAMQTKHNSKRMEGESPKHMGPRPAQKHKQIYMIIASDEIVTWGVRPKFTQSEIFSKPRNIYVYIRKYICIIR